MKGAWARDDEIMK